MERKSVIKTKQGYTIRIVIIEDDQIIRDGYAYLLGNEPDFEIAGTYQSIEEARENLVSNFPDIILLDVQLPGIRGVDAIPQLHKLVPTAHIIILTVYESEEIIFTALRNGAAGYLTKNITPEKISEAIREVITGGGSMSAGIARMVMQSFQKNTNTPLTRRETEVLEAISQGKSRNSIATQLFIDVETVKSHIKNIYQKLNVNSKEEALRVARKSKFI